MVNSDRDAWRDMREKHQLEVAAVSEGEGQAIVATLEKVRATTS